VGKARSKAATNDWRHLTLSVALILCVVGTLVVAAMLQAGAPAPQRVGTPPAPPPAEAADEPPPRAALLDEPAEPPATGPAVPYTGDADLVDRAAEDERRLGASGHGYTLQFAVVCEPKNVRQSLEALTDHADFYVLTMLYRDRACFRLCWGFYDSEGQARAEREIPEILLRMAPAPKVISVADALP